MASLFHEFSTTYVKFKEHFPKHPLTEELRSRIVHGRLPNDTWLKSRIKKMNDLLEPAWLRNDRLESDQECA